MLRHTCMFFCATGVFSLLFDYRVGRDSPCQPLRLRSMCLILIELENVFRPFPFLFRVNFLFNIKTFFALMNSKKSTFCIFCGVPEFVMLLLLFSSSLKLPQQPHRLSRLMGWGVGGRDLGLRNL